jgi:hypothetical protein
VTYRWAIGSRSGGRHLQSGGRINNTYRAALVGDLLDDSPRLTRVKVKVAGLIQATQDLVGKIADVVGQGHDSVPGSQSASSRRV